MSPWVCYWGGVVILAALLFLPATKLIWVLGMVGWNENWGLT